MSIKDILVHVDSTSASRGRLKLAVGLAQRFGARITGLHVIPEPDVPPYFKPSVVEHIAEIYAENAREAAGLAEALFREEAKNAGAAIAWECVAGDISEIIAERGRFADLVVLGQFDTENPPAISAFLLPAKVVFGTATPILVVPNGLSSYEIGSHILLSWDGSREAARAIRDAMPLLHAASRVTLLALDPARQGHLHDGIRTSELAAHLGGHGIQVEAKELSAQGKSVTEALLAQAAGLGVDLLVMGAYGHSRVLEFVFGGTTQDLLERTTIPVLMSR